MHTNNMKKSVFIILSILMLALMLPINKPVFVSKDISYCLNVAEMPKESFQKPPAKLLAIVVDDFGGYERAGVDELLESDVPITCAIMPFVDNTKTDYEKAINNKKEVILHMPMQAHVRLPESWYGPVYITNYESTDSATEKLEKCLAEMPEAKGFNIHIGSGASRNQELMKAMYDYSSSHDLYFLDSRTNLGDKCEEASKMSNSIYLGRDVFLEPNKNKSYAGVISRLNQTISVADENGYAIAIGHVGAEGGTNTARAIIDFYKSLDKEKYNVVPLSSIYDLIKSKNFK